MDLIEKLNSRERISLYTMIMGVFMLGVFIYVYYELIAPYQFDFYNFLAMSTYLILSIILVSTGLLFYKDKKFGYESNLISLGMLFSFSLLLFIKIISVNILKALDSNIFTSFSFLSYIIVISIIPTIYFIRKLFLHKDDFTLFKNVDGINIRNYTFIYLIIAFILSISLFLIYLRFFIQSYQSLHYTQQGISNMRYWGDSLYRILLDNIIFLIIGLLHLITLYFVVQQHKYSYPSIFTLVGITFYAGLNKLTYSIMLLFSGRSSIRILETLIKDFFEYFGSESMSANAFIFSMIILILSILFISLFLLKRQELYSYLEKGSDL